MKLENDRRLPIVLSVSLICLGLSQWFDPSESTMRWKRLQDVTNHLFGKHGHAKFLIFSGATWLFWNLLLIFTNSSRKIDRAVAEPQK
jgi:hypothetical protein